MLPSTFITTSQFFRDAVDFFITEGFYVVNLLCCNWVLPHVGVHSWCEEKWFAKVPSSHNTSLQRLEEFSHLFNIIASLRAYI